MARSDRVKKRKCNEKGKGYKDNGEANGKAWTDDSYFAGDVDYVASGVTRKPSAGT